MNNTKRTNRLSHITHQLHTLKAPLLCSLVLLLAACSRQEAGGMDQALQHLDEGRVTAAMIETRNLLQKNGLNADAQLLLGRIFAALGDTASAEQEIRKAEKLGMDHAAVTVALAEALLTGGQFQRLIDEIKPGGGSSAESAEITAELLAARGQAQLSLGRQQDAAASFSAARLAAPACVRALLGQAQLALLARDMAAAAALADSAFAARPKSLDVWLTRADIAQANAKPEQAIQALEQAIKLAPGSIMPRLAVARLQIDNDKLSDAQAQLDTLRKMAPKHPLVNHTQAVLHLRQRQFSPAREAAQLAVAAAPTYVPAVRLLAEAELETGFVQQAQTRLQQLLQAHPENPVVRRSYAAAMLRINQPALALEALAPLLQQAEVDPAWLSLAGQAHMQAGDYTKASALMTRAAAASPAAASDLVALGMRQVARGDTASGLAELEKASTLDAQGTGADFVLALTHLRSGAFDRALAAAQRLQVKQPGNPMVHNLLATAYIGKGDPASARNSLEKALSLDANHTPAALNLAVLDVEQGQPALARQRLQNLLAKDKGNVELITALAALQGRQGGELGDKQDGGSGELSRLLEQGRAGDAKAVGVRLLLVRRHLIDNDVAAALQVAQELQRAAPDNPDALAALGASQFVNGQRPQALATYTALLARTPNSPEATVRLGDVHAALQDTAAAEAAYAKAMGMSPDYPGAVAAMVRLLARTGRTTEALKRAEDWRRRAPQSPLGEELRGDVLASQNQFAQAARAYDAAYALAPSGDMAVKHHGAMRRAGVGQVGAKVDGSRLQQWLRQHPQDLATRHYWADQQLHAGDLAAASDNYRLVIEAQPGNAFAMNNLANVYLMQRDARGLATAQAALKLSPNDANIMDTVGQALTESGAAAQALPVLRKAVSLNPEETTYRIHLALALARSGDKPAARDEVKRLVASGRPVQIDGEMREALK